MPQINLKPVTLDKDMIFGRDCNDTCYNKSLERLSAVMLFPDNQELQIEYFQENEFLASTIRNAQNKTKRFSEQIITGINNGVLAGTCLMYFRKLNLKEVTTKTRRIGQASINTMSHIANHYNLGRKERTSGNHNGYPTVTDQHAKKIWRSHQAVSHLWAAYIHLKGLPIEPDPNDSDVDILDDIPVSVFLLIARQYERFMNDFFNGTKEGNMTRELIRPLRVRYHDWNNEDPLEFDIKQPNYIVEEVVEAMKSYSVK